jgi:isocitrate dehydrogenase
MKRFMSGSFRNWGYEVAREEYGDYTITEDEITVLRTSLKVT